MKRIIIYLFLFLLQTEFTYSQKLIPYRVKDKWGYSDNEGNIKIAIENDSVSFYSNEFSNDIMESYIIYKNGTASIIDENETTLVPFNLWNNISFLDEKYFFDKDENLLPSFVVKKGTKFGIITSKEEYRIPAKYDEIKLSQIDYGNYIGYGVIGRIGNTSYFIHSNFSEEPNNYTVYDENEIRVESPVSSKNNNKTKNKLRTFGTGSFQIFEYTKNNKYGFYKLSQNLDTIFISKPIYDSILDVYKNRGEDSDGYQVAPRKFVVRKNGKFGVIDAENNILFDFKYKTYVNHSIGYYSVKFKKRKSCGIYFFESDSELFNKDFRSISTYYDDYLMIIDSKNRKGIISKKGKKYFEN